MTDPTNRYLTAIIWLIIGGILGYNFSGFYPPKLKSLSFDAKAEMPKKYEYAKGYRP